MKNNVLPTKLVVEVAMLQFQLNIDLIYIMVSDLWFGLIRELGYELCDELDMGIYESTKIKYYDRV